MIIAQLTQSSQSLVGNGTLTRIYKTQDPQKCCPSCPQPVSPSITTTGESCTCKYRTSAVDALTKSLANERQNHCTHCRSSSRLLLGSQTSVHKLATTRLVSDSDAFPNETLSLNMQDLRNMTRVDTATNVKLAVFLQFLHLSFRSSLYVYDAW